MKAVLISIHPRYCEKIASGKKTIEVRKSVPKIPTPFKCYIYETKKDDGTLFEFVHDGDELYGEVYHGKAFPVKGAPFGWSDRMLGKVIGEFVCDEIRDWKFPYSLENCGGISVEELKATCLSADEFCKYGAGKTLYGWHISDLKIYDKPKELGEFKRPWRNCGRFGSRFCKYFCDRMVDNDMFEGRCNQNDDYGNPISRPPQSWMYVEEI